ncbi:MAG TPA: hypothetical protein VF939_21685 [Puia sp.]
MKKRLFQVLCFLCCSAILCAQNLQINDMIGMRKAGIEQIDSTMKEKGYAKKVVAQNSDFTIITYLYNNVENGLLVQRTLHFSKRPKISYSELEYGVWQKEDALNCIDQLIKTGFKKANLSLPDIGAKSSSTSMLYRKGNNSISYREQDDGSNHTIYIFSINNTDYK